MIIKVYVRFYSLGKLFKRLIFPQIILFTFQCSPKGFHGAIVNTSANPGHTLRHLCFIYSSLKSLVSVLEPTVAMNKGTVSVQLGYCQVKGLKHKFIVVGMP